MLMSSKCAASFWRSLAFSKRSLFDPNSPDHATLRIRVTMNR
jgi:hypothetical protein